MLFEVVRLSKVIDRCNIEHQVESQFRVVAENSTDLQNVFASDMDSVVASKAPMLKDPVAEKLFDAAHEG